ncbi:helicase protein [Teladorsagia circumcincta]|uniref:DNA 3'-5' helicase n=1 Tax=Teladorsagia circumcincta TaxID=45464 RepID=A0A2G9V5G4_TELCI|nr:helicase protein [Teladorsagia circumcincta]
MDSSRRTAVHEKWVSGKYNVIIATVAFGMGIDKPDVRYVIHHALPKSVENYFQESGRAGRDGLSAVCILYFRLSDVFRQSTMVCTEKTGLRNLYSMVRYATTQKTNDRGSNRITGAKLVELTTKRLGSKPIVERALCHALLNGHLKQDFHFTPYAIHSYIVSGPKGAKQSTIIMKCKKSDCDMTTKSSRKRKLDDVTAKSETLPDEIYLD